MKTAIGFLSEGYKIRGNFFSASHQSKSVPTMLILSGFPGNEEDVLGLGDGLSQQGFNCMTFNYRGTHQSQGNYSLRNSQVDIQAAFEYIQKPQSVSRFNIDPHKIVLGGWSYGGGMSLTFASNNSQVRHVFSIAGTDHGEFAREYQRSDIFSSMVDTIFEDVKYPRGPVRFAGKSAIRKELINNPDLYDLILQAPSLTDRNILLIGGWDDENVVVENHVLPLYRTLTDLGATNVVIRVFQDNHAFEESRTELVDTLIAWVQSLSFRNLSF